MTAQPREPRCPFCGVTPRETDATNFPGTYEHPWEKKGCPLDGVQLVRSDWAKRAPASRPDPLAARLVELRAKATPGPWCAESLGEKGDGSNIIGVAFHPDDKNAEHPLSGWLEPYDVEGNEIDYYRDQDIAEIEHRTQGANQNTDLILALVNNLDAIIAALAGRDGWRAGVEAAPEWNVKLFDLVTRWNEAAKDRRATALKMTGSERHSLFGRAAVFETCASNLTDAILALARPSPSPPTGGALADPASAEDGR